MPQKRYLCTRARRVVKLGKWSKRQEKVNIRSSTRNMSQYVRSENYKHDLMAPHTCQLPGAFLAGIDCDFLTISTVVNK